MTWDHRRWGHQEDPIHQSHIGQLVGEANCSERFRFRRLEEAAGTFEPTTVGGKTAIGTAVHETLRRYLTPPFVDRLLAGEPPSRQSLDARLVRELDCAIGGLEAVWKNTTRERELDAARWMVAGALASVATRAAEVLAVEAPFVAQLGDLWLEGAVDLLFRARSGALVLADWKTGQNRLAQVVLDHTPWQLAIYAHAAAAGTFHPGAEQERRLDHFPDETWVVHLREFVPYSRATSKTIGRSEEAQYFGKAIGEKVRLQKGELRGPAWYRASCTVEDTSRLYVQMRKVVRAVRLGAFMPHDGEHCARCPFRLPCKTGGYAVAGAERNEVEAALRGLDLGGLDELEAVA